MTTEEDKEFLLEQANELKEILDIMPGDIGTLNSLVFTYLQLGETDEAADYAMELRTTLTAMGDTEQLDALAKAYLELAPDNVVFQELAQVDAAPAITPQPVKETPAPVEIAYELPEEPAAPEPIAEEKVPTIIQQSQPLDQPVENFSTDETPSLPNHFDFGMPDISLDELSMQLNHELELGEFLKRENVITDEACDVAVEQLINSSGDGSVATCLTLVTELNKLEHMNMQRVYGVLSQKTNTPFIKVSQFDIPDELTELFSLKTAKRLGIVPFSQMGREYMVATLNPIDETLQNTLENYLKTKIHFYLTSADEVEHYYDNLM